MSDLIRQIRENMQRLSDDELVKVVHVDYRDYSDEAIAIAKEEMALRGVKLREEPAATIPPDREAPAEQVGAPLMPLALQRRRLSGGVFIASAALCGFAAVLGIAAVREWKKEFTYIDYSQGIVVPPPPISPIWIALVAVIMIFCFWIGIKRKPRWEFLLGFSFLIIGIIAFMISAALTLRIMSQATAALSGALEKSGLIVGGAAVLSFIGGMARRLGNR